MVKPSIEYKSVLNSVKGNREKLQVLFDQHLPTVRKIDAILGDKSNDLEFVGNIMLNVIDSYARTIAEDFDEDQISILIDSIFHNAASFGLLFLEEMKND